MTINQILHNNVSPGVHNTENTATRKVLNNSTFSQVLERSSLGDGVQSFAPLTSGNAGLDAIFHEAGRFGLRLYCLPAS